MRMSMTMSRRDKDGTMYSSALYVVVFKIRAPRYLFVIQ